MNIWRNFIDGIAPRETGPSDRDLADLGMTRTDYEMLCSSAPGTRRRMEAMAAHFGLVPDDIDAEPGLALEIATKCGHCRAAAACQRAVEAGRMFDANRCPNAATYADLAR